MAAVAMPRGRAIGFYVLMWSIALLACAMIGQLDEANANYGSHLIVWDLVFGTYLLPRDRRPPVDVGVAEMPGFPQDYWGQLLSPFRWRSLRDG